MVSLKGEIGKAASAKHKGKKRKITVASTTITISPGSTIKVAFKLNGAGKTQLLTAGHLLVKLTLTIRQGSETPVVSSHTINLKAPKHHGHKEKSASRLSAATMATVPFRPRRSTGDGKKITVTSLAEGPSGGLWVGTTSGLAQVENGAFRRVTIGGKPHADHVMSLHADADGTLWLGTTDAGLQRLRGGRLASVTSRQGLPNDTVLSVHDDRTGRIWLSTGQGILAVERADLEAAMDGRSARISAITITEAEGLRDRECSGGVQPSVWLGRDGRLWYPTIAGVAVVDPRRVSMNTRPPSIQVEEVVADGRPVAPGATLDLPAGVRHLEIRYAAPSFVAPERMKFEHRLEGLEPGFFAAGADRVAHYTALGPGRYRFRVRAANEDGVWGEQDAPVTFAVRPYFWQTLWFYLLCGCALALAAVAIVELRVRRLRHREEELKRRVAEEMARVEVLSGLLPICAWCKKVRHDAGYWGQIEEYISSHSKLEFTHGICPDCLARVMPTKA